MLNSLSSSFFSSMNRRYIALSLLVTTGILLVYRRYIHHGTLQTYRTPALQIKSRAYFFALICFLLASRQIPWGNQFHDGEGQGVDIMIMLDVSQSMQVIDMPDERSRLQFSKDTIKSLLTRKPNARRGIGIFAGEAQGVVPLTTDLQLISTALAGVDYQNVVKQGTSLAEAISLGTQRFDPASSEGNLLLIMSDGGEEEVTLPQTTKDFLSSGNISVLVMGIGSKEGGPIIEGVDLFGNSVLKLRQGAPVISKLEEKQLRNIAQQANGSYIQGSETSVDRVVNQIDRIPPKPLEGASSSIQKTTTPLFIMFGICLLLIGIFAEPVSRRTKRLHLS